MLTLAKSPRLTLKKSSHNTQHVTLAQVYYALRKQTIKARPTISASFWRYRESGYCYINANGITRRVSTADFLHIQQNAEKRYSFWNGAKVSGSAATVRKVFLLGFGV